MEWLGDEAGVDGFHLETVHRGGAGAVEDAGLAEQEAVAPVVMCMLQPAPIDPPSPEESSTT